MGSDLYISSAGAIARLNDLDVIANNLANSGTTGFKRDVPIFEALLEGYLQGWDGEPQTGLEALVYVATGDVATSFQMGNIVRTGSAMDVAIQGPGFFEIETPTGVQFTRAGSFHVNREGLLATPDGMPVLGEGGPIDVGGQSVTLEASGDVVNTAGAVLGRLSVVVFEDPSVLAKAGGSRFRAPADVTPDPVDGAKLVPESIESSNVQPVAELSSLMLVQRAFEANMRALQAGDEATDRLLSEVNR